MKTLSESCLQVVCRNFAGLSGQLSQKNLPAAVRERLLHLLVSHDQLTPLGRPVISSHLLSHSLTRVHFVGSLQLDDGFLEQMGGSRAALESVHVERCGHVTDAGVAGLLRTQTHLRSLALKWLTINGACLDALDCPDFLRHLSLKGCAAVAPQSIVKAVQRHRGLEELNLKGARTLSCEDLSAMAAALGNGLRDVNLSECLAVRRQGLADLAAHCGRLRKLKMQACMNVSPEGLETLVLNSRYLEHLDLSYCSRNDHKLTLDTLEALPETLEKLVLKGVQFEASPQAFLEVCPLLNRLTSLNLSGFGFLSDALLEKCLTVLGPQLAELHLSGSFDKLSDAGVGHVAAHCTALRHLGLNLLHKLSLDGLLPLLRDEARAGRLESLLLASCTAVAQPVLEELASSCGSLRKLDLSGVGGAKVSDGLLSRLAERCGESLELLNLRGCRELTDVGVTALAAACPSLTSLSLSGITNVTDEAIGKLAKGCPRLRELFLSGCMMISPQMINFVQDECLERVSVYHVNPAAPHSANSTIAKNLDTGEFVWMQTS